MKKLFLVSFVILLAACSHKKSKENLGYIASRESDSGRSRVLEAYDVLVTDPSITVKQAGDWTIATKTVDGTEMIWSFPPENHPAYPSMVLREFKRNNNKFEILTEVTCAAEKTICDQLVREFIQINRQIEAMNQ